MDRTVIGMTLRAVVSLAGLLGLVGCAAQADPQYAGEALMMISGSVVASEAKLTDDVLPVVAWYSGGDDPSDEPPKHVQSAEVRGEFPNQFTMRLYEPPPDEAVSEARGPGGTLVAIARIQAAYGSMRESWGKYPPDPKSYVCEPKGDEICDPLLPAWLAGMAENYLVLYLPDGTHEDDRLEEVFGPLPAGYHLVEVRERTAAEHAEEDACFEAAELRALAQFNAEHGTSYGASAEIPLDDGDAYYALEIEYNTECDSPGQAHMEIVPSGLDHPISLRIASDLKFIEF